MKTHKKSWYFHSHQLRVLDLSHERNRLNRKPLLTFPPEGVSKLLWDTVNRGSPGQAQLAKNNERGHSSLNWHLSPFH